MNHKHAYLIEAHKYGKQLITLLQMLDDEHNDIYLHIDKKTKNFPFKLIEGTCSKSSVYFTARYNVQWGGFSQIKAELALLSAATKNRDYDYLHLISGDDLPIKKQVQIREFFENNSGKEFVCFDSNVFNAEYRVYYRYFLQEFIGKSTKNKLSFVLSKIQAATVKIQKKCSIKRNQDIEFRKGPNWFSITNDLARYIVGCEKEIIKRYRFSKCADEVFLQTIVYNSPFYQNVYSLDYSNPCHSMVRAVDWKRGNPYVFRKDDFDELMDREELFARKFDENIDYDIIEMICDYCGNDNQGQI